MPRRTDIGSVLVIGSGPIVIGQACEFDYSGTQACRVLRAEGLRVSLVNSNPATIMTDPEFADATYVEPITPEVVAQIIARERPDAVLATLGGQTALNTAVALQEAGVLDEYGVQLIGADIDAIRAGEDRQAFKEIVASVGGESARSRIAHSLDECLEAAEDLGYPLVVRPSFTLGGAGSGLARHTDDLRRIVAAGLRASPTSEVLLEESVLGWKEYELEVMRDGADNAVVVCSIENVDPMGVHTGDSVTVAPAMTLTDREYQRLRDLALAIIRAVGVEAGGCNIQFAVHPDTGRVVVIEMNPRVSRSSALASKATGFPIAKIAAKLALGYTLDEIPNDITRETPASFEPTLDYVVVKVPRFTFEKFPGADASLTTTMKSVGEAMAIGRSFPEALQKALRSLEMPGSSFTWRGAPGDADALVEASRTPHDGRLRTIQQALRAGASVSDLYAATGIDAWFLDQIAFINEVAGQVYLAHGGNPARQAGRLLRRADRRTARQRGGPGVGGGGPLVPARPGPPAGLQDRRYVRGRVRGPHALPLLVLRRGDRGRTVGTAEGHRARQRAEPHRAGHRVRLRVRACGLRAARCGLRDHHGQLQPGDGVHGLRHGRPAVLRAVLTVEDVLEVVHAETRDGNLTGVLVQLGGQTPLRIAQNLADAGVPIVGTSPAAIHLAEERGAFGTGAAEAGLPAPKHGVANSFEEAKSVADRIGYPVLVRPSYVLGGRGMEIVYDDDTLRAYIGRRPRSRPSIPSSSTASSTMRSRSTWTRSSTAQSCSSAASWSTSRRPVSTPAIRRARSRRSRSAAASCAHPRSTEAIARGVGVRGLLERPVRAARRPTPLRAGGQPSGLPHRAVRQQGDGGAAGEGGCAHHARRLRLRAARRGPAPARRRRRPAAGEPDRGQGGGRCRSAGSVTSTAAGWTPCSARR